MHIVFDILLWITYLIALYFSIFWFLVFLSSDLSIDRKRRIKLSNYPFVSIVVPAYNEEATVIPTIKSVIDLDYPDNRYEIIVVNDGSIDSTLKKVKQFKSQCSFKNFKVIDQQNQGKATAMNNALKDIRGVFFACLDADSFVEPLTLKKMLDVYEQSKNPSLSIVTPFMKIKKPDTLVHKLQYLEYLVSMFVARLMSFIDCLYVAPGPFSLYRTQVIRNLGGFDPSTLTEDQEIAYRVQAHNLQIKQCPDGYVYTVGPPTFKGLYNQRNRWFKGGLQNLWKYRKMVFDKKYGDFGVAQLPINIMAFFLCCSAIFFFSYYLVVPILNGIKNLLLINFDIIPFLTNLTFSFNLLNVDVSKTFVLYFLLGISLLLISLAHKNAGEKIKTQGYIYLVPYFLFYYLVLSFVAVVVVFEMAVNKKQKW